MHSLGAQRFSCTFLGIKSFNKLLLLGILLLLVLLLSGLLLLLLPFCSLIFIHVRIDWDSQRLARSVHTFAAWLARRQSCHSASAWQLQTKLLLQLGLSLILSVSLSLRLQSTVSRSRCPRVAGEFQRRSWESVWALELQLNQIGNRLQASTRSEAPPKTCHTTSGGRGRTGKRWRVREVESERERAKINWVQI